MKLGAILSLICAVFYIIFQSLSGAYFMHLYPDVFAFFARATYFWENGNLTFLGHNEYQPGAISFFITLTPVFLIDSSIESFKWALFFANSVFIFLIGFLLIKMKKTEGIFLMSVLLVFLGPILLFRFDLLVILLTILSFYLWEKNLKILSMIILAFAVITKVYPIIFLPYLLFQSFKTGKKFDAPYYFLIFTSAFLVFLLLYTYFFQIKLFDTWVSYNFHNLKSVATESVWASLIYFWQYLNTQTLPAMESAYGINAVARASLYPPIPFYNYFWVIPIGFFYLLFFAKNKSWEKINYVFICFLLLIFLVFSKVLSNQYLAWFIFMLPLIDWKILIKRNWVINIFLLIISIILHTYVYPLNYSAWVDMLVLGNVNPFLLWCVLISNLLLIILAVRIGFDVYKNHKSH